MTDETDTKAKSPVRRFQRIEETLAVQYVEGDAAAEAIVRGWLGLGHTDQILISDGSWIVKRRGDGDMYIVRNEDFVREFAEVLSV